MSQNPVNRWANPAEPLDEQYFAWVDRAAEQRAEAGAADPDSVSGPANPADPDSIPDPGPADPAAPPARSRRPARRTLLIGLLVLAIVVAGGIAVQRLTGDGSGWKPWRGGPPGPGYATPAPTGPPVVDTAPGAPAARAAVMPIDLLDGLPQPDLVEPLGVWDDVALFDLGYRLAGQTDRGNFVFASVLRAVDVKTGAVLWTYDKVPGDKQFLMANGFGAVAVADGKLAFSLAVAGQMTVDGGTSAQYCIAGTYLAVADLRSGRVSASSYLDAHCAAAGAAVLAQMQRLVAYQAGIVVVDRWLGASSLSMATTAAFRDTDLANPLWSTAIQSSSTTWSSPWAYSDRLLPGGWIMTMQGAYRGLDGSLPSAGFPAYQAGQADAVYSAGSTLIEAHQTIDPAFGQVRPWIDWIGIWAVPPAGLVWRYTPDPGWVVAPGLFSSGSPVLAVADGAAIVLECQYDNYVVQAARLSAISLSNGRKLWSRPYPFSPAGLTNEVSYASTGTPTVDDTGNVELAPPGMSAAGVVVRTLDTPLVAAVQAGDRSMVLLADRDSGKISLYNAGTGLPVSSHDSVVTTGGWLAESLPVFQCGPAWACLVTSQSGSNTTVTTLDLATPGLDLVSVDQWPLIPTATSQPALYQTDLGLIGIAQTDQRYEFVRL